MLARARELAPVLAARAVETAELRRVPEATIRDFQEAGFFRMLQPKRWGGFEMDPKAFFDVQWTLASGCPSSAWVFGVVAVHSWQLALFDKRAQEDVWEADRSALIASSYAPTGKVERVEGGYRVSGRWSFSSGCDCCQWVFLGGFAPEMHTFLLPASDYRIEDNWHVAGLRGTGSKDIVVDAAFVPEHRTHLLMDGFRGKSPGQTENTSALYRIPFGQIFVRSVSTSAIGIAQGALDAYRKVALSRIGASDKKEVRLDPTAQFACAEAATLLDEVKTVLHRDVERWMEHANAERLPPMDERVQCRYHSANTVAKCVQAVDALFAASGGRAIFQDAPIQRFFQDAHAAQAHFANKTDKPGRNLGRILFERETEDFFL
jgi:3-hydroxy-9,10-secoandrosta-1,3,5(10)-triene-9,17-dione monooxygenase